MQLLRQVRLKSGPADEHPFSLPVFSSFESLNFDTPVTFFVGGNGTGKSTLLEGIAAAARLPGLTGADVERSPLMESGRHLAPRLTLVKTKPVKHGLFFRADDVTGFIQRLQRDMRTFSDMEGEFSTIEGDWGRDRAMALARGQREALLNRYGRDDSVAGDGVASEEALFARSHGELFLQLLHSRITAAGLYLLDEPETPLSPENQIAFLALLKDSVARGCQFVIATHSPIIMAALGSRLYDFDQHPPESVAWEDLEHVQLTRAFLNSPETFLRHL